MTDFQTGLMISVIGLVVTFSALGVFIGVIIILQKLFPPKAGKAKQAEPITAEVIETPSAPGEEEITAALAAVAYLRSRRSGQLGASLAGGPGPFRTSR